MLLQNGTKINIKQLSMRINIEPSIGEILCKPWSSGSALF